MNSTAPGRSPVAVVSVFRVVCASTAIDEIQCSTAADECDNLQFVAVAEAAVRMLASRHELTVPFDCHQLRIAFQLLKQIRHAHSIAQLHLFAVHMLSHQSQPFTLALQLGNVLQQFS